MPALVTEGWQRSARRSADPSKKVPHMLGLPRFPPVVPNWHVATRLLPRAMRGVPWFPCLDLFSIHDIRHIRAAAKTARAPRSQIL